MPTSVGHLDEHPAVRDRAPLAVEGEGVDHARAAVREVHRAAVQAPAEPVGDGEAVEHPLDPSLPVEPVEGSAPGTVVVGQRAGPEPALRIARGVVHPRPGRRDLCEAPQLAVGREAGEPQPRGQQPPLVVLDGRDRTDGPGHLVRANGDQGAVVGDEVAVDTAVQDVHAEELTPASVPAGPFAEEVLVGRAGDGSARCAGATRRASAGHSACSIARATRALPPDDPEADGGDDQDRDHEIVQAACSLSPPPSRPRFHDAPQRNVVSGRAAPGDARRPCRRPACRSPSGSPPSPAACGCRRPWP